MGEIRNFSRADAAAVAALFQKTFRNSGKVTRSLEAYLAEAYLEHPWFDPDVASRVHVGEEGRITGFIGVFPGRFEYRGKTLRAAIAGTLMVESPEREPLAGARLLRSVVKGPQDISISETTNLVSQRLWEPLGGKVVPLQSLDWFRVLRPGGTALAALAERAPSASLFASVARAGDWMTQSLVKGTFQPAEPNARLTVHSEVSDSDFAAALLDLAQAIELRPAWSQSDLEWFLSQAALKERYGTMRRAIVRGRKDEVVGCYVYHGKRRGIGRVLQVLARPGTMGDVLDCLFHEADRAGLSGLRGRASQQLINALLTRNCVFLHRASTVFHTADRDLAAAVETGGALITGLAGESWTRLVGGNFN